MKSLKDFFSYHSENYALGFFALALIFGGWTYEFPQLNQLVEILLVLAFLVRGPKPIETERVRRPYTPFFRALMIAVSCLAIISFATVVVANQSRFFSSLAAQDDGGQTRNTTYSTKRA